MNQIEWIQAQFKKGRIITPQEALKECGTMRLAVHINILRERGFNIVTHTRMAKNGSRYAAYQLIKKTKNVISK